MAKAMTPIVQPKSLGARGRSTKAARGRGGEAALAQMVDGLREHLARTGLDEGQTQQVGARLSASLVQEAKKRTGLSSNTDLLTFALANVAIEDRFADAFERAHGTIDPDLDIGL